MNKKGPTIADVATRAGVSKGAVSFALNGRPGLAKATVDRILAAADELGWRPSNRARSLSVSKAFALGLVITRDPGVLSSDPFFPAFIGGVESVLAPRGQALVLQVVAPGEDEEAGYRRLAQDGRVDGVFLSDLRHDDPRIDLLTSLGLPGGHAEPSRGARRRSRRSAWTTGRERSPSSSTCSSSATAGSRTSPALRTSFTRPPVGTPSSVR